MLRMKKRFYNNRPFSVFSSFNGTLVRFLIKVDVLTLTFTKFLCLVLLRSTETSLMLWLYGNSFMKKADNQFHVIISSLPM